MRITTRIISTLLTVCLLLGSLSVLFTIGASAEDVETTTGTTGTAEEIDLSKINYLTEAYHSAEEKLATMKMRFEKGDYQLWINEFTGEVAVVNTKTEEILMSNPYDVGLDSAADSVKAELLSQIIIGYTGNELTGTNVFTSYTDAALNNQIKVKSIKNGMRVEYTIGREETKYLVPRLITKERFETQILEPLKAGVEASNMSEIEKKFLVNNTFMSRFTLRDPDAMKSDRALADLYKEVPITATIGAVYMIDVNIAPAELQMLEEIIKTYCPAYTYEELDMDHTETEYESEDKNPPVFKMALEYTLDDMGLSVTLPANGVRFDESIYQLSYVTILPYMGAGQYSNERPNEGYTFIPDGSGAIFRFEDLATTGATVGGAIYGQDYAYHTITGKYQEIFKMPVFGIVRDNKYVFEQSATGAYSVVENENPTSSGFFAIIEEGDALAEIKSTHLGQKAHYHTVQLSVNPRPSDTYNISGGAVTGTGSSWTVVSDRKYLGNYTVRYIMLTDDKVAAEKGITDYYPATYTGMAYAYRDYLTSPYSTGTQNESAENQMTVLERLASDKFESQIPLYLETFGAVETIEKVLSVPVNVMTPLTSFDDIKQIYNDLSQSGVDITNINFKLTGYANGGMYSTVPYKLSWEKAVGGNKGFKELLEFANDINKTSSTDGKNLGIFPDFDFAYVSNMSSFDGISLKDHAVKTIDNRYIGRATYSATYQAYIIDGGLAISPAYFSRFYDKLAENYLDYSINETGSDLNISVATLGTDLNSDFDEDEPYNREDSKDFTIEAFKNLSETYGNVMTNGGNAYTWQYVDYILDMPIDSSRYLSASNTVPFTGMVLHGYLQYAGSPINMEGNIQYGVLKAIENGASIYFILTYDNATILKEDILLNQYYSVRYDIWAGSYNDEGKFEAGELVDVYHQVNDVTHDLQDKLITNHVMLTGQRIPDADELVADAEAVENARIEAEKKAAEDAEKKLRRELLESRTTALAAATTALGNADLAGARLTSAVTNVTNLVTSLNAIKKQIEEAGEDTDVSALESSVKTTTNSIQVAYLNTVLANYKTVKSAYETIHDKDRIINESIAYFIANGTYSEQFIEDCKANVEPIKALCEQIDALYAAAEAAYNEVLTVGNGIIVVEEEKEIVEEETNAINSRYLVDDGTIVAVTYGEVGEDYRTFILNYNYFAISVEYNGETYEIDRYGYVVVDAKN